MTSRPAGLTALLVFSSLACDDSAGFEQIDTVRASIVGTPASMLRAATTPGVGASLPSGFTLPTDTGEEIAVVARGYEFTGDYLAIDGAARESERSSFILKGDGQNIYGWLVLPDRDLAFEYTTSPQGNVIVQRVPITKIYPVCNDGPPEADAPLFEPDTPTAAAAGDPPHVGEYDGSDTNKLQSRPGATKVLFMDVAALTLAKAELWRAWQIVSGAYSAFEVNVTTDAAVYEAAEARNRGKACISNEDGRSTCAVNAFGTSRCCDVYNKGSGAYQGLTTSHELGHLMGLAARRRRLGGRVLRRVLRLQVGSRHGKHARPRTAGARRRCFSGARASTPAPPQRRTISRSSPGTSPTGKTTFRTPRRWSSRAAGRCRPSTIAGRSRATPTAIRSPSRSAAAGDARRWSSIASNTSRARTWTSTPRFRTRAA